MGKLDQLIARAIESARKSQLQNAHGAVCLGHGRPNIRAGKYATIHAERASIEYVLNNPRIKSWKKRGGFDIVVVRFRRGELTYSRPCVNCAKFMHECGVRRVYYTDYDGSIVCEKIVDLITQDLQISSGNKEVMNNP